MAWSIYEIRHVESRTAYVGRTTRPDKRWAQHKSLLDHGKHFNENLQAAWDFYGPEKFEYEVLVSGLDEAGAEDVERSRVASLIARDLAYNIAEGGRRGDCLLNHPYRDEILARRSASQRATAEAMGAEARKALWGRPGESNPNYGRKHTDEAKAAISAAAKGNKRCLGLKRSEEHRKLLSKLAAARVGDRNPFHGRKHSEETKRRLAAANRGRLPANARPVEIEGRRYASVTEAARRIGVSPGAIIYWIRSDGLPGCFYLDGPALRGEVAV